MFSGPATCCPDANNISDDALLRGPGYGIVTDLLLCDANRRNTSFAFLLLRVQEILRSLETGDPESRGHPARVKRNRRTHERA